MGRSRVLSVAVNVLVAVVAAAAGSGLELTGPDRDEHLIAAPAWAYVAAQIAAAAMLLVRRQRPYTVALSIAAISLFAPAWAALLAPYAVTAHGGGRRWRQWAVVAIVAAAFLGARGPGQSPTRSPRPPSSCRPRCSACTSAPGGDWWPS
ncbi:hypothetical protein [Micromonospora sp. WMMD710]|uniref:hypothetical protein n=1 Tax=Micromonospora sp. WMMD710 TaxID=3016085 RepID=UPI0024173398|nr:hypothetical protein [Micromonospora sp. WMMD710]MDG4757268.1 hypothetical protein [Micromonospora sp. WMMD710]